MDAIESLVRRLNPKLQIRLSRTRTDMLLESDVIDATCMKLESLGYSIEQRLTTSQHGDDIIAAKSADRPRKLFVEAKGETSSRQNSERHGKPFDSAQVGVHVAEAFYKAAKVLSRKVEKGTEFVSAIALPDTKLHRDCVVKIQLVLDQLRIVVFWVRENEAVEVSSPFSL